MNIISIEPTPSPNTMKINLDETLPKGVKRTYSAKDAAMVPDGLYKRILELPGVVSVFHTSDFLAVDRTPKGDWPSILSGVRRLFGEEPAGAPSAEETASDSDPVKEATAWVQVFRQIPMQIRIRTETEEVRRAMPERFTQAAMRAGLASPNLIKERKLVELGVRYGNLEEIADTTVQELDASYDDERLGKLVEAAESVGFEGREDVPVIARESLSAEETERYLNSADWKDRYAALQRINPEPDNLPFFAKAIRDPQSSVRRLASVYLGDIRTPEALALLFEALRDSSVSVRRTAGDTLSDIGDRAAMRPMAEALKDPNKLVRWRAARFLYEAGDESVLPALHEASEDPEFEVRLQVRMAIERIESGGAAEGSVWQQMTRRND